MNLAATPAPQPRGACPCLSAPMPTGDGLLVRLLPTGTISLAALAHLCEAARAYGNGAIEITSRGSIQVRGLSDSSVVRFATAIATSEIAADDGIAVHDNALAGLGAGEIFDASELAATLRRALASQAIAGRLSPKLSIAIDGGGTPSLAALAADFRLFAEDTNGEPTLRVAAGGDAVNATELGSIAIADAVGAVLRLLGVLAEHGPAARARDVAAIDGGDVFRSAISDLLLSAQPRTSKNEWKGVSAIGLHRLRNGSVASGCELAFGHTDAATLERLIDAARAAGADGFRTAPGRGLLTLGLAEPTASTFVQAATRLGFVMRADDPRRRVVACAGAPICASAHLASRALAPLIGEAIAAHGCGTIHVSGCSKGCAHAGAAALTVVGMPNGAALVADGTARGTPFTLVSVGDLPSALARYIDRHKQEASEYEVAHV